MLTPAQENYLTTIYRIEQTEGLVRITGLAADLGCKPPTVTRTIQRLILEGVVTHESRGTVHLTRSGRATAEQLVRRRDDLTLWLQAVLGLPPDLAQFDACRLEHSLSPLAAIRLREYLERLDLSGRKSGESVMPSSRHEGSRQPDSQSGPGAKTSELTEL